MSPIRIVLASANRHKVREFQELANDAIPGAFEILSPAEFGGMPVVVEDAGTFEGNALRKARALRARVPRDTWVLADDSGLCVDALGGAPGVESAQYAGPGAGDSANLTRLVDAMRDVPDERRGAAFVCVLALIDPSGAERIFEGRCEGRLRREPAGIGGFGYDPLFMPAESDRTFAELGAEAKNRLSHRAAAWRKLVVAEIFTEGRKAR